MIAILDEECLRPGDATDASFLEKLSAQLDGHAHYKSHRKVDAKTQKIMGRDVSAHIHTLVTHIQRRTGFVDELEIMTLQ